MNFHTFALVNAIFNNCISLCVGVCNISITLLFFNTSSQVVLEINRNKTVLKENLYLLFFIITIYNNLITYLKFTIYCKSGQRARTNKDFSCKTSFNEYFRTRI